MPLPHIQESIQNIIKHHVDSTKQLQRSIVVVTFNLNIKCSMVDNAFYV